MKHILVTGGAGFIGSHLTQALLNKGYKVRVLDNLIYGQRLWVPQGAEFMLGDITNLEICHQAMKGVEGVFHCAAMSRAGPSFDNIDLCSQVNILGTQNILMAALKANVKKIIYSGSSTYYGSRPPPHSEYKTAAEFLNVYALTKYVGEQYCLMFDEMFNLPCLILRYFNVYGPRQPQEGAYALVLGLFLQRWKKGEALVIHGNGQQRRDFIHVMDVVRANLAALEGNLRHDIFNVGSGTNISIQELANIISQKQIYQARRLADSDVTLADISHIEKKLKWRPQITLQEGLHEMMERVKQGLESYAEFHSL